MDIPQHTPTHNEASRLVAEAYKMAQQSRALNIWARRQLLNTEKNLDFTERQLQAAEIQYSTIVEVIERDRYHVIQYEPYGVPIMPYVIEQDQGEGC